MPDIERIPFDFSGDAALETADRLEDILRSGYWSDRPLNYEDERTLLLLRLLSIGGIAVYRRPYASRKDVTPEMRQRAGHLNLYMGKRHVSQTLIDIADIFSEYEFDTAKTVFNSLYFPELKAYVRCGGLPADRLLELLEQDGCDMILLFSDTQAADGDYFHAFTRPMPRELFLEALAQMRDKITATMHEAYQKTRERDERIIPSVSVWNETE